MAGLTHGITGGNEFLAGGAAAGTAAADSLGGAAAGTAAADSLGGAGLESARGTGAFGAAAGGKVRTAK